jgi:2'-5' RNA ligase
MNWYERFIIAEKVQSGDENFSWVWLDVPSEIREIHDAVTKDIKEKDLYTEQKGKDDWTHGIEDKPHLTVQYGITFDDPKDVIEALKDSSGGEVSIKCIEIFEKDDYDVLVVRCESKALAQIHETLLEELEIVDTYPEYKPHITIAYFKKGRANKYKDIAQKAFVDYKIGFDFDEVIFEDRNDKDTIIKLN